MFCFSESQRIKDVVELRDVMPTLLDLCSSTIPDGDGISLKPVLEGTNMCWL